MQIPTKNCLFIIILSPCISQNNCISNFLPSYIIPPDDDCEGDLVCMQRSGDEPIPGCGGDPREYADYCVPPVGRSSVVTAAVDTPSSGAVGISGIASIIASVGAAILSMF